MGVAAASDGNLPRKVIIANVTQTAKHTEIADFFTGAIFSATGHTLAAQWQSGEATKVVVGLSASAETIGPGRNIEIVLGTAVSATVAVALNGIQFQGANLTIKRPSAYTGQAPKLKLQGVSIKDLVASDGADKASGVKAS